ncbi:iron ABC transporter permease [Methanoculleus sp. MH98A]|uniref:FecCD family ABC transporter permease n=1 Tax=Methanoculleus sp. MH98A TaxID=1495314 RepID=UPI0004A080D9|nr:iron ABC transporter permease [Methanoculleus sp. MH98A]KDE55888.1 iron ABC transporter permease [Methanoculleus sp. MH98A]
MHVADGEISRAYLRYTGRKIAFLCAGCVVLFLLLVTAVSVGAVTIPFLDVILIFSGQGDTVTWHAIVWNIRLPQALAAVIAGAGLAVAGVVMQSILRNPLGSPFTLGISNAAAFGAALAVIVFGAGEMTSTLTDAVVINNPYLTSCAAFLCCMVATAVILAIAHLRTASPEVMVLAGVALSSLFSAGTMFLQYFADDTQLAAVVFWTFGDVGRAGWTEIWIMGIFVAASCIYFILNAWNYNAVDVGDEAAKGLGVNVSRLRLVGMVVASLVSAMTVAFLGIIGFVGLVCPHMVRRLIGDDHRYLIPGSCLAGAILLLAADTAARLVVAPNLLPVAVLTAFIGAPMFIYLLFRGYRR